MSKVHRVSARNTALKTTVEWKRNALASFPYLYVDLQQEDATIYTVFFELLPRCLKAHKKGDDTELSRIYAFADWCFHQEDKDLWNAAGVAFYEHLIDDPIAVAAIPDWLSPDVFEGVSGLFKYQMSAEAYDALWLAYYERDTE